jgi:hypothetical protein
VGAGELANQLPRLDDLPGVQSGRRLVEDQDLGVVDDGLRQAHALPVALRELGAVPVGHVGHPRPLHDLADAILDVGAKALDLRHERQVLADGHVRIERRRLRQVARTPLCLERVVEDVVPCHQCAPARGRHVAGNNAHCCGLAGTIGAQEAQDLARFDPKTHIVDGRHGAVALREVIHLDHGVRSVMKDSV